MAVACPAWWEGSWFPDEHVSKRKNNFKEIKEEKKGKLNWNQKWNIRLVANDTHAVNTHLPAHMLTCMYSHRKIQVQAFCETKNTHLGKMGIQMNLRAAIGRESGSSLMVFHCFVLSFSHSPQPVFSPPLEVFGQGGVSKEPVLFHVMIT